jgi:hypothetical protein
VHLLRLFWLCGIVAVRYRERQRTIQTELTIQQAADLLDVSHIDLLALVATGELSAHTPWMVSRAFPPMRCLPINENLTPNVCKSLMN